MGFASSDAEGHILHFEVEDTGPGIHSEEMGGLFEPFIQTSEGVRSVEGTGLGLPISKRLVELMGGDLTVTSTIGKGSLFRFQIAVEPADNATVQKVRSRRAIGMAPGQPVYRILIAEDRETNRLLLMKILRPFDFELREASNGRDAIALWEEWEPHLIFMDMQMPVMNGHEATKHIKATTRGQATVIIALTASAFEDQRNLILSEGCDDFIRKPFREHEIFEKIEHHLGVQFVYEDLGEPGPGGEQRKRVELRREQLERLPVQWREQLTMATVRGDIDTMIELVEEIRIDHSEVAENLSLLAHEYNYEAILELIREDETSDES